MTSECAAQNFEELYTAPEVASAFEALYANKDGLQDKLMNFWTELATHFNGNDNVIGYDILNEPWAANLYKEPDLFLHPSSFDATKLNAFNQRAN